MEYEFSIHPIGVQESNASGTLINIATFETPGL
jgi:hypothetical protein